MKVLIQRVTHAAVDVDSVTIGQIDAGILALVGVEKQDNRETLGRMAQKLLKYRIFPDSEGKMNLSLTDTGGGLLVVSQFTLAADTRKGLRPSFSSSAPPDLARSLFDEFVAALRAQHPNVETGRFGADMKVRLLNDGPVTFMLES
ncbi:D-aminoacyl-tRNA deacylase [Teredinibacter turnerae]|uniref:D-aminoacyl-tRNA deacylase n=1 Tax=Teredinibacter turnerae TaxID=2426 RepID=UPI000365F3E4|nr:D-aminoacyl-tRNA deacylase [Teredinibacter turnerae]